MFLPACRIQCNWQSPSTQLSKITLSECFYYHKISSCYLRLTMMSWFTLKETWKSHRQHMLDCSEARSQFAFLQKWSVYSRYKTWQLYCKLLWQAPYSSHGEEVSHRLLAACHKCFHALGLQVILSMWSSLVLDYLGNMTHHQLVNHIQNTAPQIMQN